MALVLWDKFTPYLAPELPGCPDASLALALAETAADFCARTHLWQEDLDPEVTLAGEPLYELMGSGVIELFRQVAVGGTVLTPMLRSDADITQLATEGTPTHFWAVNDTSIRLYPIPDSAQSLTATVVIKPSLTARGIESFLFESHLATLVSGTIYRLARIPGKQWTNEALAATHRALYEAGIISARVRNLHNIPMRVTPHSF